jgi:hypothetical protein
MKKDEIKVGGTYLAKVTDRVVPVRLDRENARGGWDATNLVTNKQVRIKSAQRLRGPAERSPAERAPAERSAGPAERATPVKAEQAVTEARAAEAKAPATPEAPAKKAAKPRTPKTQKPAKVKVNGAHPGSVSSRESSAGLPHTMLAGNAASICLGWDRLRFSM